METETLLSSHHVKHGCSTSEQTKAEVMSLFCRWLDDLGDMGNWALTSKFSKTNGERPVNEESVVMEQSFALLLKSLHLGRALTKVSL